MNAKENVFSVELTGLRPIMFDRYCGELTKKVTMDPVDRAYVKPDSTLYVPVENLMSFLSAQNTESAPQRVIGKGWKAVARAALSFVEIAGDDDYGATLYYGDRPARRDDLVIRHHVARVKKGQLAIPNPKHRPVLNRPWSLKFDIRLEENRDLDAGTLKSLFEGGGRAIGLGTYRGPFGKFEVTGWSKAK